jgi:DNA-binding CsgD family transcriptional regulator
LRRAAEIADACGARGLRARALDGLAALGDRPRRLMFSGADSLTASERRIADLAAHGRSNRDIAQDLFVTPKTVENHLGRVYMKLGIKGRRELASALAA